MAEQGRRGTGWVLVIGAAILYLVALTLHLDLGADGAEQHWKQGRRAPGREGARASTAPIGYYSCTSVGESRSADWETERRARNRRMSGQSNAV